MVAFSFKRRFIVPIRMGLGLSYELDDIVVPDIGPKRQTIRQKGKRPPPRPGQGLQLFYAMRTKQCRKIGETVCREAIPIIIWIGGESLVIELGGRLLGTLETDKFARADGFAGVLDMLAFWHKEHRGIDKFEGTCIQWGDDHGR